MGSSATTKGHRKERLARLNEIKLVFIVNKIIGVSGFVI
jgi:hypothetical protein